MWVMATRENKAREREKKEIEKEELETGNEFGRYTVLR